MIMSNPNLLKCVYFCAYYMFNIIQNVHGFFRVYNSKVHVSVNQKLNYNFKHLNYLAFSPKQPTQNVLVN